MTVPAVFNNYDWAQECKRIDTAAVHRGRIKAMNYDPAVFIRYCEMQRDQAERTGFYDSATYIQHVIDDMKEEPK